MTDLSFLVEYIDPITLGICLCIGYSLKEAKVFKWFDNQRIPLCMLVLGCIIGIVTNIGNINAVVVLRGMISGLASTGLYEMLKNLFKYDGKSKK